VRTSSLSLKSYIFDSLYICLYLFIYLQLFFICFRVKSGALKAPVRPYLYKAAEQKETSWKEVSSFLGFLFLSLISISLSLSLSLSLTHSWLRMWQDFSLLV